MLKEVVQMTLYLKVLKMNFHHLVGQYFQIIQITVLHNQIHELILVLMLQNLTPFGQLSLVTTLNILLRLKYKYQSLEQPSACFILQTGLSGMDYLRNLLW